MSPAPWAAHFGLARTPFGKCIPRDLFARQAHAQTIARISFRVVESAFAGHQRARDVVAHVIGYDDLNTRRLLAMAGRGRFRSARITAGWPRRMPANARREPVTAAVRQMDTT